MPDAFVADRAARRSFLWVWSVATLLKTWIALRLPLFVDEAFYWQEGRHLAPAYSDLPGLTAWLCRLGESVFGHSVFGLRMPFLLLGLALPWLVVALARQATTPARAWQAGALACLLPLAATLGTMALPDVPLAVATLLCLLGGARLLRGVVVWGAREDMDGRGSRRSYGGASGADGLGAALLALGLAMGALTHYRFVAVIGVGVLSLLSLAEGRRLLRAPRVWAALAVGVAAWAPLLWWNLANADAGLRFQLVDRHPWSLHAGGLWFPLIQAMWATPLLLAAMVLAARRGGGWGAEPAHPLSEREPERVTEAGHPLSEPEPRAEPGHPLSEAEASVAEREPGHPLSETALRAEPQVRRFLARAGAGVLLGFFLLGFVADAERSSFHWPLPAYLALLPLVPALLAGWSRRWRAITWMLAAVGFIGVAGYSAAIASPAIRAQAAASRQYPANFAGWDVLAAAVTDARARMPAGTRLLADNFKTGAELGFVFDDPRIDVLDHPLNHHHGRAPQLALWGLLHDDRSRLGDAPRLLVVGARDVDGKDLLRRYHALCTMLGPLPPPQVVNIDHGRKRYLLFALPATRIEGACTLPALAWVDTPGSGDRVPPRFSVQGWAFKDGVGLAKVEVLLNGEAVATADYAIPRPDIAAYWQISTDPQHPNVAFRADIDASALPPGRQWLGLRLHGRDGSVEDWWEQPVVVEPGMGNGE